ncbi:flippase-like domain-containing protein [Roseospirillum parvum]|uniref:Putative membrane protein n=1 Tax=Roseospirillum parvum TaxID=83401 RepID=A0A1G8D1C9_9PROT|nr:flippase-like domain-containing protein [Roseospirillum parvum]SDH51354.1 putative membrane protein [Roseospirillum parvum]
MPRLPRRLLVPALGLLGLAGAAALIAANQPARIWDALLTLGPGVVPFTLLHLIALVCDAEGWRCLMPPDRRPSRRATFAMRWVSEAVNTLLPVAQVGGEVVRARLLTRHLKARGTPLGAGAAAATVVAAMTSGLVATIVFTLLGLLALMIAGGDPGALATESALAVAGTLGLLALFLAAQATLARRPGWIDSHLARLAGRLKGEFAEHVATGGHDFRATIGTIYRNPRAVALSVAWHLASWLVDAAALWLGLALLESAGGPAAALVLEALSSAARAAVFAVPAGLGVQEASFVLLGELVGVAAPAALALALLRRLREATLGLIGLSLWPRLERAEGR